MQISTKQHVNHRPGQNTKDKVVPNADGLVCIGQYLATKKGGKRAQMYVDLHQFTHHYESVICDAKNPWA